MSERARAAYAAYGESVGWKNFRGDPMPQFSDLPEAIRNAWDAACIGALQHWVATDFRSACMNDELVKQSAAMIQVGMEQGDSAVKCIRQTIADFVVQLVDPEAIHRIE